MTAEPSEGQVTEGFRSLEVRWIFPGRLETAVAGFGRFPIEMESREDTYLLDSRLHGLSVKVRGGRSLEVKVYRGARESWMWRAAPADAWSPGRSGPFPLARSTSTAATRPVGDWYAKGDASAGSHSPADRSWRAARGWTRSRGATWNSPRSAPVAKPGGPWGSRRVDLPICSAAHSRAPPGSCSPTPCPVRNPASMNPGPTCSGCPSNPATRATPTPEDSALCRAGA
jgi:hypothetical protein